ncbi:cell division protein CrgA [Corynebacterium sp. CCUG 71335]|uniref:cell division protein CrgA n=1 Tax=unclassified Corynebacterium TaxID=2624378 RepID=UPI00210C4864|nr:MULTISPECIES: cell division protein CrgA [unclassified Corynebacterium]MCQ4619532.1 cell division protein CrgA [Corynebacterium pseudogenitalium]MCQ4620011.1 cell division protein CrgA [Corynebacterium sp. CCUG 71335]MCQ4624410.1 cell division protein CrgA [Corynebacterium sp. CCUG 69979]MCQ4626933.1 cell division protein CrgA [Corynebacterium sp. CCUG 65737]
MPKAKVTKDTAATPVTTTSTGANRTPVKINTGGTPMWYKILMFGFMAIGLLWLVVNYLAGPQIPVMNELGAWNYLIGFAGLIIGLLMTMGWR